MIHLNWEEIKKMRLTIPLVVLIMGIVFAWQVSATGWEWYQDYHHQFASVTEVKQIADKVDSYVKDSKLTDATSLIQDTKDQLFNLQQWETSQGGSTPITNARKNELEGRLSRLIEYQRCLLDNKSNCEAIR